MSLFFIYFEGFFVSLSLVAAIGLQNAFVLEQSIKKNHVYLIVALCIFFDVSFFWLGAYGIDFIKQSLPDLFYILRWVGACFLFFYGMRALFFSLRSRSEGLVVSDTPYVEKLKSGDLEKNPPKKMAKKNMTRAQVIIMTAAVTLLNPHFYIDTFFLLGSLATEHQSEQKIIFLLGASSGSVSWFFLLSFLGKKLASFFENIWAWRILDGIISLMMFFWAFTLAFGFGVDK